MASGRLASPSLNSHQALQGLEGLLCVLFLVLCPWGVPPAPPPPACPQRGACPRRRCRVAPVCGLCLLQQLARGSHPEAALAGTPGPGA